MSQSTTLREVELVLTTPADACTQVTNSIHVHGNIALIERGFVIDSVYIVTV